MVSGRMFALTYVLPELIIVQGGNGASHMKIVADTAGIPEQLCEPIGGTKSLSGAGQHMQCTDHFIF
jgi:hypothetical protein